MCKVDKVNKYRWRCGSAEHSNLVDRKWRAAERFKCTKHNGDHSRPVPVADSHARKHRSNDVKRWTLYERHCALRVENSILLCRWSTVYLYGRVITLWVSIGWKMKLMSGVRVRGGKIRLENDRSGWEATGRRERRRRGASPTRLRPAPAAALSINTYEYVEL